jgi:hypothetical protein
MSVLILNRQSKDSMLLAFAVGYGSRSWFVGCLVERFVDSHQAPDFLGTGCVAPFHAATSIVYSPRILSSPLLISYNTQLVGVFQQRAPPT